MWINPSFYRDELLENFSREAFGHTSLTLPNGEQIRLDLEYQNEDKFREI